MRASFTAIVALIGAAFLLVGCSQSKSPIQPSSLSSPTSPTTSAANMAALAEPSAAQTQTQVPFKGMFEGNDTVIPPTITTAATGTGTHVGHFSLTDVVTLTSLTGTGHWIAANGDIIYTTFVATPVPGPVVFKITENHTITGGTGRFAGARGSFTVERTHIVEASPDGTHVTFGSFDGSITSPGAAD
jgi:hypothetical protein